MVCPKQGLLLFMLLLFSIEFNSMHAPSLRVTPLGAIDWNVIAERQDHVFGALKAPATMRCIKSYGLVRVFCSETRIYVFYTLRTAVAEPFGTAWRPVRHTNHDYFPIPIISNLGMH